MARTVVVAVVCISVARLGFMINYLASTLLLSRGYYTITPIGNSNWA